MKLRTGIAALFLLALFSAAAQEKPDALKLYRQGRELEAKNRMADAVVIYNEAIEVCKQDLVVNPRNMDAYTIYGWALVRMEKYSEAVTICQEALKITSDHRVVETLGEAYFYLKDYKESLKNMERYIDAAPRGERISTAYFFVGEIYRLNRSFNRAEIAYTAAVYLEPAMSLWWYRLATVRENVGDREGAATAYQRALRLRPDYKEASDGLKRVTV
ncbi:tetratricopeptide repeat protein [Brucepastera parasyntrophica]|uniref:tetratricopeptide repeat protein n=1 Tax=Brucepastera parasyntrophica TaxID=2880008 RepID=UPI00210B821F|nr:tetratricopeptide repeat protein [Brucepastera parasyntrophica]ULQ58810.1 tetratricopeptide repeat protein [Brucepastera parasyntrophica]